MHGCTGACVGIPTVVIILKKARHPTRCDPSFFILLVWFYVCCVVFSFSQLPFLEDECPSVAKQNDMTASQAMSRRVRCLRPLERAGAVFDTLSACQHDCFPVVDDEGGDVLVGTILR